MPKITGAELLVRCLEAEGVDTVFSISGGQLLSIYDAIRDRPKMRLIVPRTEWAAASMADGYTRVAGKPAVVLTTVGAGAISAVPGLATAWADKTPIISLAAQVQSWKMDPFHESLQGCDQAELFRPITRWNGVVRQWKRIPEFVQKAFREALAGRRGPAHLDLPVDVMFERREVSEAELKRLVPPPSRYRFTGEIRGDAERIQTAARLLREAKRPLILSGGGVRAARAWDDLQAFLNHTRLPASTSMSGMGTLAPSHPCNIGGPSYVGGEPFHRAIKQADVVLAIGATFSGLEGFGQPPLWGEEIRFIVVDVDPGMIGLNVLPEIAIVGDAGSVLRDLLEAAKDISAQPWPESEWLQSLKKDQAAWQRKLAQEADPNAKPIHPGYAVKVAREKLPEDAIVIVDGGNTALWGATYGLPERPNSAFFPCGMGTLGVGIPLAIGARLAAPDRPVALLVGDGAFIYNLQEIETAHRLGIPLAIMLMNDGCYNMIRMAQTFMMGGRYIGTDIEGVNYADMVRGYGGQAQTVEDPKELPAALEKLKDPDGVVLADVHIDRYTSPLQLASFAKVEFGGVEMEPLKAIRGLFANPDARKGRDLLNRLEYLWKIR
jgi:acetolactate synthase-1/2/3 large subunit